MKFFKLAPALAAAAAALSLGACTNANDQTPDDLKVSEAVFSPLAGLVPIPNNLFFVGSTDGTLNIPSSNPAAVAANGLDGWSTVAPAYTAFNKPIDASSLPGRAIVVHVCIDGGGNPAEGIAPTFAPIGAGADGNVTSKFTIKPANTGDFRLALIPNEPLRAGEDPTGGCNTAAGQLNGYVAYLLSGIQDTDGETFTASTLYDLAGSSTPLVDASGNITAAGSNAGLTPTDAATMEQVRRLVNGLEGLAGLLNIPAEAIILSWHFSTQSISPGLLTAKARAMPQASQFQFSGQTETFLPALSANGLPQADVFIGTVDTQYYSPVPALGGNPLAGSWVADVNAAGNSGALKDASLPDEQQFVTRINPFATQQATLTIPAIITTPDVDGPATVPVAIFLHGIGQDRTNIFPVSETLASQGIATIAIDHPLHGIHDASNPLAQACAATPNCGERHFNLGVDINQDGNVDGGDSALYFLNLSSLLSGRDNIRQSATDLIGLVRTLQAGITVTDIAGNAITLDGSDIHFVGHSLGGIVGSVFLGTEDSGNIGEATLAMPGGGIGKLLDASASFGPLVGSLLAQNGVTEGTYTFEQFLGFAQQVIDSADPVNFGTLAAAKHPIHLIEVVGGTGGAVPDTVVPNDAFPPAPSDDLVTEPGLGGTNALAAAANGETSTNAGGNGNLADIPAMLGPQGMRGRVCFGSGNHGSILDPSGGQLNALTTAEMQAQTAGFFSTGVVAVGASMQDVVSTGVVVNCP